MTGAPGSPPVEPDGEFARIARLLRPLSRGFPGALDLTDDAGTVKAPVGHELVVTTDAMVAGVHFLPDDDPADIAWKLLAVNLSDLAAKAAEPLAYSLVTALPRDLAPDWLSRFADGLRVGQERWGVHLLGGDSVSTPGPVMLTVSALGLVPDGRMVRRAGARAGDVVMVSGTIGDAALGLRIALGQPLPTVDPEHAAALLGRLRRPEPRLALRSVLRDAATAALDVSDGLVADLGHLAATSGVALVLGADAVPLSDAARSVLAGAPDLLETMLTGGDDYEVAFTVPPERAASVVAAAAMAGIAVTPIGSVSTGPPGVTIRRADGTELHPTRRGWTHF